MSYCAQVIRRLRLLIPTMLLSLPLNTAVADSFQGVITDVFADDVDSEFAYLSVQNDMRTVYINIRQTNICDTVKALQNHLGCTVKVTGTLNKEVTRRNRRILQAMVQIHSLDDIVILDRPVQGDYDVPELLDHPPSLPTLAACGPRKILGTVIARWNGNAFLVRDKTENIYKVRLREQRLPVLGQVIEAVGKVATDLYRYNLMQARWRPVKGTAPRSPEQPDPVTLNELFSRDGRKIINTEKYGKLVTVWGMLKNTLVDETGRRKLLLVDGPHQLVIDCGELSLTIGFPDEGAFLSVTGVCVLDSENWQPGMGFPHVSGLFLVPRTIDDIETLRRPSWWTPARFRIAFLLLFAVIIVIIIWNRSLRRLVTRRSRELLRTEIDKATETLRVDERTRLAVELHDTLSQNLTAVSFQIAASASKLAEDPPAAAGLLTKADRMLTSCRTELKNCLFDLRGNALEDPDFTTAIRKTLAPYESAAILSIRCNVPRAKCSDSTAHAILRIVRELVANAIRHGGAKSVGVTGECAEGVIRIAVKDDGCGFDTTTPPGIREGHFGLTGIRERIKRLGGAFQIESCPGEGTEAILRLTLPHPNGENK